MKEITIASWTDYVTQIEALKAMHDELKENSQYAVYPLLFRGQPDSSMPLQTTLERASNSAFTLLKYFAFVSKCKSRAESVTGMLWPLLNEDEYEVELNKPSFPLSGFPGYEYYAYLRHHGFPSPLLDWSQSPYVATLFAFLPYTNNNVEQVSVYTYLESCDGFKSGNNNSPKIHRLGPYLRTHMRHYLQQSDYTVCTSGDALDMRFAAHEEVFKRADPKQDLLWKLNIPKSQGLTFLEHLYQMNVTPYSLFQTEDKLMEDLWLSEGVVRNHF